LVECTEITAARAGEVFSAEALSEAATFLISPRGSKLKLSCSKAALELLSEDMPLKLVLLRELLISGVTGELGREECKLLAEGAAVRSSIGGLSFAAAGSAGSSPS
jgi:hypothetical protein